MGELTSLKDIMEEWMKRTPEQIEADREAGFDRERSFRRGYHQGWDAALEAIFKMWQEGMRRKDAYALAALHENALARWRAKDRDQFLPPPGFSRDILLDALKKHREEKSMDIAERQEEDWE